MYVCICTHAYAYEGFFPTNEKYENTLFTRKRVQDDFYSDVTITKLYFFPVEHNTRSDISPRVANRDRLDKTAVCLVVNLAWYLRSRVLFEEYSCILHTPSAAVVIQVSRTDRLNFPIIVHGMHICKRNEFISWTPVSKDSGIWDR